MRFLLRAAVAALGLWLATELVSGFTIASAGTLVLAALLLGVCNALVRPVLVLLTLPITLITLGLFLLVVNAAMIGLVALVLPGFTVAGLGSGVAAAVITGLVSWLGSALVKDER